MPEVRRDDLDAGDWSGEDAQHKVYRQNGKLMTIPPPPSRQSLGYLTVFENPKHGLFGGYLVVNGVGRPLEFHCTGAGQGKPCQRDSLRTDTPPLPLWRARSAGLFLRQSKTEPLIVLTDTAAMLSAGEFISPPVALVTTGLPEGHPPAADPRSPVWRADGSHRGHQPHWQRLAIGEHELALEAGRPALRAELVEDIQRIAASWDLAEPFDRIRAAIDEARRGG